MDENKYDVVVTESQLGLILTSLEEYSSLRNGDFSPFVSDIAKEGREVDEMNDFEKEEYIRRKDEYEVRLAISFKNICTTFRPVKTFLQKLSDEMSGIIRFYFYTNGKIKQKQRYPVSYTKQPFLEIIKRNKGYLPEDGMAYFTPLWTKSDFFVKRQIWESNMDDFMRYKLGLVYPTMSECDGNLIIDVERITGLKYLQRRVVVDDRRPKKVGKVNA